jgi:colicin import membrane protein
MSKQAKTRAEQQFAATQKKDKEFLKDKELARLKNDEHVARLRALRLAKEAADKEAADQAEAEKAEKAAAKKKTPKKKK